MQEKRARPTYKNAGKTNGPPTRTLKNYVALSTRIPREARKAIPQEHQQHLASDMTPTTTPTTTPREAKRSKEKWRDAKRCEEMRKDVKRSKEKRSEDKKNIFFVEIK